MLPSVLVIAGSDSGGGAGIQADIKTVSALGGYATTAITALTAQNTQGVQGIHEVQPEFVQQQITAVMDDIGADAIKIGMLLNEAVINHVADTLHTYPDIPLVIDPVMVAKGGNKLLHDDAFAALKEQLLPLATIITPNIPEAEVLTGMTIDSVNDMEQAAEKMLEQYGTAILLKGGHLEGDILTDLLVMPEGCISLEAPHIPTPHTHGTGCTLASAIATGIAQELPLEQAVRRAHTCVQQAILHAPGIGNGHGPLGHKSMSF